MESQNAKLTRREALKLMAAASATISVLNQQTFGATFVPPARPYGVDPVLNKTYHPGDLWPLTLNPAQKKTVKALADLIIPADEHSPAASEVGAVEFLDEWISAPYEVQRADRREILQGLAWLEREAHNRFGTRFAACAASQQTAIADDIAFPAKAKPQYRTAAAFFGKFRNLIAGGFYATAKGWQDIGYVGNRALAKFTGPPESVLQKLGLG